MKTTPFAAALLAALLAASPVAPRAVGAPAPGGDGADLACELRLEPSVLELDTRAHWVTAVIEPSEFTPQQIALSSLRLQGAVAVDNKGTGIGDGDGDGRLVASWSATAGGGVAAVWNGRRGDGAKASPGVYFMRLDAGGGSAVSGRAIVLE